MTTECRIDLVGSRRSGGDRYWCLEHRADATAKYGRQASQCRRAHLRPVEPEEIYVLDVSSYEGGVGLWGAAAPVYDTTQFPLQTGVHVHARSSIGGHKAVDDTFRQVTLTYGSTSGEFGVISELDAIYNMVAGVFGLRTKQVNCGWCGYAHLDKDWFSVHPHQTHLCAGCGKTFRDTERGIGNPIASLNSTLREPKRGKKQGHPGKTFNQSDYPGGIQLWGSNPAILWTNPKAEEEGIHLHAFDENDDIVIDDTFSKLNIDGLDLDPDMVRIFMAQSALPHIMGRLVELLCPHCNLVVSPTGSDKPWW